MAVKENRLGSVVHQADELPELGRGRRTIRGQSDIDDWNVAVFGRGVLGVVPIFACVIAAQIDDRANATVVDEFANEGGIWLGGTVTLSRDDGKVIRP